MKIIRAWLEKAKEPENWRPKSYNPTGVAVEGVKGTVAYVRGCGR